MIKIKKRLFESRVLTFYQEKVFQEGDKIRAMPYWLIRIPKDINKSLYDIEVPTNSLFKKLGEILSIGRIIKNKEDNSDLVFIDEQKLHEIKKYIEDNPKEVL